MTLKRLLAILLIVGGGIGIAYVVFTYMSWPRYIIVLGVASLLMLGSTVGILLSERTPLSPDAQRLWTKICSNTGDPYTSSELMEELHLNINQLAAALGELHDHVTTGPKRNNKSTYVKKEEK